MAACLEALQQQDYTMEEVEVIVVDNGSTDQSAKICERYPVQLLMETAHKSPYWCRNAGIAAARGSILVLLDSNCTPTPGWLAAGVAELAKKQASIVTGPIRYQFSEKKTLAERLDYLYSYISADDLPQVTALSAGHLFFNRSLIENIGYFLPHIRSLGDIEWTHRAYKQGLPFGFATKAIVQYPAKRRRAAIRKMIRLGGGRKALWKAQGRSVISAAWIGQIGKNFLPPSPAFFREMQQRNRQEDMDVPSPVLYVGLWAIKLCRAWGMLR